MPAIIDNIICAKCKNGYYNLNSSYTNIKLKCMDYKKVKDNKCEHFNKKKEIEINE